MRLFWSEFAPHPLLCLEYVSGGSLADQVDISPSECFGLLHQCLSALAYLHNSDPPIVHRDLKPDNILVEFRDAERIVIKLADFGLSRDYDDLSTICGSLLYLAPEIYRNRRYIEEGGQGRVSYTPAVDVWSLGVVVYGFLCPLPDYDDGGATWCVKVRKTFEDDLHHKRDVLKEFLLEAMVVIRPWERWLTEACHTGIQRLPVPAAGRWGTPARVPHVSEEERTTIHKPSLVAGPLWQQDSLGGTVVPNGDTVGARDPPEASGPSRKRSIVRPALSPSSRRRTKRLEHVSVSEPSAPKQHRDHFYDHHAHDWLYATGLEESGREQGVFGWNQGEYGGPSAEPPCRPFSINDTEAATQPLARVLPPENDGPTHSVHTDNLWATTEPWADAGAALDYVDQEQPCPQVSSHQLGEESEDIPAHLHGGDGVCDVAESSALLEAINRVPRTDSQSG